MSLISSSLNRIYAVLAWLLAATGIFHLVTTWQLTNQTDFTRVWFFGAGIAMIQAAVFNLLHHVYGQNAQGLRWATRGFNGLLLVFAAVAGRVIGASVPEQIFLLGVFGVLLVFSFTNAAFRPNQE